MIHYFPDDWMAMAILDCFYLLEKVNLAQRHRKLFKILMLKYLDYFGLFVYSLIIVFFFKSYLNGRS